MARAHLFTGFALLLWLGPTAQAQDGGQGKGTPPQQAQDGGQGKHPPVGDLAGTDRRVSELANDNQRQSTQLAAMEARLAKLEGANPEGTPLTDYIWTAGKFGLYLVLFVFVLWLKIRFNRAMTSHKNAMKNYDDTMASLESLGARGTPLGNNRNVTQSESDRGLRDNLKADVKRNTVANDRFERFIDDSNTRMRNIEKRLTDRTTKSGQLRGTTENRRSSISTQESSQEEQKGGVWSSQKQKRQAGQDTAQVASPISAVAPVESRDKLRSGERTGGPETPTQEDARRSPNVLEQKVRGKYSGDPVAERAIRPDPRNADNLPNVENLLKYAQESHRRQTLEQVSEGISKALNRNRTSLILKSIQPDSTSDEPVFRQVTNSDVPEHGVVVRLIESQLAYFVPTDTITVLADIFTDCVPGTDFNKGTLPILKYRASDSRYILEKMGSIES